jgi:hypothetical protein
MLGIEVPMLRFGRTPDGLELIDPAAREIEHGLAAEESVLRQATAQGVFTAGRGFKVFGAGIKAAYAWRARCDLEAGEGGSVRVRVEMDASDNESSRPRSVVIEFEDGKGCALAALPDYVGTVVVDQGEVASVAYEPAENSWRWDMYGDLRDQVRELRAMVSVATRHGVFRVDQDEARVVAERIRLLKGIDPTLGLYAAYAYNDAGLAREIGFLDSYMREDLNGSLFDVAMLQRNPNLDAQSMEPLDVSPFCPMLSQGWSLLDAKRVRLAEPVQAARHHLAPSLWTLFEPEGVSILHDAISSGAIR